MSETPQSDLTPSGALLRLLTYIRKHEGKVWQFEENCVACRITFTNAPRPRYFCAYHGAEAALEMAGIDPGTPPLKITGLEIIP